MNNNGNEELALQEQHIYGSSRLGMRKSNDGTTFEKQYELTNHLGNVLAVISDTKNADGTAKVVSATDYYPFGMQMPARTLQGEGYRYGFNNAEKINEYSGLGNTYDLGARIYNPRLGKMFSPDPREKEYPWQSTYAYYANSPIWQVDDKGEGAPVAVGVGIGAAEAALIATGVISTGIILQKTTSGDIEMTTDAKAIVNQIVTTGTIMLVQYAKELGIIKDNPGYKEQQRREREAKTKAEQTDIAHNKMVKDNVGTVSPDGTPEPKRPMKPGAETIIIGTGVVVGVAEQLTNPDPSKDAYDAHMEKAKTKAETNDKKEQPKQEGSNLK